MSLTRLRHARQEIAEPPGRPACRRAASAIDLRPERGQAVGVVAARVLSRAHRIGSERPLTLWNRVIAAVPAYEVEASISFMHDGGRLRNQNRLCAAVRIGLAWRVVDRRSMSRSLNKVFDLLEGLRRQNPVLCAFGLDAHVDVSKR